MKRDNKLLCAVNTTAGENTRVPMVPVNVRNGEFKMNLAARCLANNWRRIAFIGATKHAGKTTALNAYIAQVAAYHNAETIGLCSIGLDGERLDTILGVKKPAITVPPGTLVVSAERALEQSEAELEWLVELPIDSPLGTVMVARVKQPGKVILAGVRQRQHIEQIISLLEAHGATVCLVDGAFDRVAAASPHLVDAAVLAVGAVAGKTVEDVARAAFPIIHRFQMPKVTDDLRDALRTAQEQGNIGLWDGEKLSLLPPHQGMFGLTGGPHWSQSVQVVFLPGALTDTLLQSLTNVAQPLRIVVQHPAQIMISSDKTRQFYRRGHQIFVWTPLPLAAIAVNPHHILGFDLPKQSLMEAIQELAPSVPVYDALDVYDSLDFYDALEVDDPWLTPGKGVQPSHKEAQS